MALLVSPNTVEKDGGYKITLTGLSLADGDYYFHVGSTGTSADPRAYAGAYGTGDVVTVTSTSGAFITPPIAEPGNYSIAAISTGGGGPAVLPSGIAYHEKNHRSATFSYRTLMVSWLNTGPRDIVEEEGQA